MICTFIFILEQFYFADEKVIDEIQQALNELERLKKQEKLLQLYRRLVNQNLQVNLHILEKIKELENE